MSSEALQLPPGERPLLFWGPNVLIQLAWGTDSFSLQQSLTSHPSDYWAHILFLGSHKVIASSFIYDKNGAWPTCSIHVKWDHIDENTLETRNFKTKLPPLGGDQKTWNLKWRPYCTFSLGQKCGWWAGLSQRRRWTSQERPRTQSWRSWWSCCDRRGRTSRARPDCADPVSSAPGTGQKTPEGEAGLYE